MSRETQLIKVEGDGPCDEADQMHPTTNYPGGPNAMTRARTVLRTLILCGLALTMLGFAETNKSKTTVTYPSAFGVSQRVSDLPIDLAPFPDREMPEPLPSALARHGYRGPWQLDPALQTETLPQVGATQG